MIRSPQQQIVDEVMHSRRSVRAFLPTLVAREDIEAILDIAARAPSGSNVQPWKVYVVTGPSKERLTRDILHAYDDPAYKQAHKPEYVYYPRRWIAPYIERRRKVGLDLYGLLGIARGDGASMRAQHARNFCFFDAPVGLFFTIDRVMEQGSWLDYGMFLQNIMLAARARGLDTCPQAAFVDFHAIIAAHLEMPPNEMLVCGMALGFADPGKTENKLVTEREPASGFARFLE